MHKRGAGIGFGGGLPVWPKTQNVSVEADSISARGRSRRRRVRRDGASRPTVARTAAAIPVGPKQKNIRRCGIYPARRRSRRRGVPGTISGLRAGPCGPVGLRNAPAGAVRASSPTEVCYNVGMSFPGWPRRFPLAVGADSISARGRSHRRGVRRDGASRPTAARIDAAFPFSLKHKIYS